MLKKHYQVLVLGYGKMGHVMESLLQERHQLTFWDKFPPPGLTPAPLEEAAPAADVVLFCMPVMPHRETAQLLAPLLQPDCLCLSIAKGLDEKGKPAAQVFAEVFGEAQAFGVLYGPMISAEVLGGRSGFAQLGYNKAQYAEVATSLFQGSNLHIENTTDITGISWAAILKNVYALGFGMADGLQLGDNVRGLLAVTAMQELERIVCLLGGQSGSAWHLAGLGDLITTATSETSHHHNTGRMLANGQLNDIKGEGVNTLAMVRKFQLFRQADYPLYDLIQRCVNEPAGLHEQFRLFLQQGYFGHDSRG